MAVGIKSNEPDARIVYADIIDLPPYHVPEKERMSMLSRASQFSSFDALAGYTEMIDEEEREVGSFEKLSETEMDIMNAKINLIADAVENDHCPVLRFIYFIDDISKPGGSYVSITERVRRVDMTSRTIQLFKKVGISESYMILDMDRIRDITGDLVDGVDDEFGST